MEIGSEKFLSARPHKAHTDHFRAPFCCFLGPFNSQDFLATAAGRSMITAGSEVTCDDATHEERCIHTRTYWWVIWGLKLNVIRTKYKKRGVGGGHEGFCGGWLVGCGGPKGNRTNKRKTLQPKSFYKKNQTGNQLKKRISVVKSDFYRCTQHAELLTSWAQ